VGAGVLTILVFRLEALPTLGHFPKDTELALGMTLLELHYILQVFCVRREDEAGNWGASDIWARSKRRGFSPGAAARHRGRTRVPTDLYISLFSRLYLSEIFFPLLFLAFLRLDISSF